MAIDLSAVDAIYTQGFVAYLTRLHTFVDALELLRHHDQCVADCRLIYDPGLG